MIALSIALYNYKVCILRYTMWPIHWTILAELSGKHHSRKMIASWARLKTLGRTGPGARERSAMADFAFDTDSEDEIPAGWEERVTLDGDVYYAKYKNSQNSILLCYVRLRKVIFLLVSFRNMFS